MADKQTHAEVHYRKGSRDRRCGLCTMFRTDPVHCTAVVDPIKPDEVCDLFKRRRMSIYNNSAHG